MTAVAAAPCAHRDEWFDRTVCACGSMHNYCVDCGELRGYCAVAQEVVRMTETEPIQAPDDTPAEPADDPVPEPTEDPEVEPKS